MTKLRLPVILPLVGIFVIASSGLAAPPKASGLLSWRGPDQTGAIPGKGYPETGGPRRRKSPLTHKVKGGTPVIANGKLYSFGYYDDPGFTDVQEALIGRILRRESSREYRFSDFMTWSTTATRLDLPLSTRKPKRLPAEFKWAADGLHG